MPTSKLFGGRTGQITVDGASFDLHSIHNRVWMLDESGETVGFGELIGQRAQIRVDGDEFELTRCRSRDRFAEVLMNDEVVGAVYGNGRGRRLVRVQIDGVDQPRALLFIAAVRVAGWRGFRSALVFGVSGTPPQVWYGDGSPGGFDPSAGGGFEIGTGGGGGGDGG